MGLSIMSRDHLPICEKLMKEMKRKKIDDILVVIGGVIPKRDIRLSPRDWDSRACFPRRDFFRQIDPMDQRDTLNKECVRAE